MADQTSGLLSPFLRRRRIAVALSQLGDGRVLDYGCGTGELARWVPAGRYLGVDVDGDSLRIARARYPSHELRTLESFEATARPRSFHNVVALAVLEHLPDPARWLASVRPLLTGDGRVILTTPHPRGRTLHDLGAGIGLLSREASDDHEDFLGRRDLDRLARESGFRLALARRFLLGLNQLFVLVPESGAGPRGS